MGCLCVSCVGAEESPATSCMNTHREGQTDTQTQTAKHTNSRRVLQQRENGRHRREGSSSERRRAFCRRLITPSVGRYPSRSLFLLFLIVREGWWWWGERRGGGEAGRRGEPLSLSFPLQQSDKQTHTQTQICICIYIYGPYTNRTTTCY